MKLTNLALIVALAVGVSAPAYAAMTPEEQATAKADMDKAGTTDEARMTFYKGMAPERQTWWKTQCNSGEFSSLSGEEIQSRGDVPSFCKAILK